MKLQWNFLQVAVFVLCTFLVFFSSTSLMASEDQRDPLIRISALPNDLNVEEVLEKVSHDFSRDSGVPASGKIPQFLNP